MDLAVVQAVAGCHLVHRQRASLVACNARGAAQRFNGLQVLDQHVDVLHFDGGEGEGNGELKCVVRDTVMTCGVRDTMITCVVRDTVMTLCLLQCRTWGRSPSGTLATMMPMAKMSACEHASDGMHVTGESDGGVG